MILFRAVELWRKGLDEGLSWAQRCRITAFVELERMIWRHKDNILNTVRNGLGDEPQDQVAAQDRLRLPQHRHDDRPCHAVLLVNRNSMARQKAERPNKQRPWHDSDGMRRPTLMPEEPKETPKYFIKGTPKTANDFFMEGNNDVVYHDRSAKHTGEPAFKILVTGEGVQKKVIAVAPDRLYRLNGDGR